LDEHDAAIDLRTGTDLNDAAVSKLSLLVTLPSSEHGIRMNILGADLCGRSCAEVLHVRNKDLSSRQGWVDFLSKVSINGAHATPGVRRLEVDEGDSISLLEAMQHPTSTPTPTPTPTSSTLNSVQPTPFLLPNLQELRLGPNTFPGHAFWLEGDEDPFRTLKACMLARAASGLPLDTLTIIRAAPASHTQANLYYNRVC
jgi:hypothetical protein